MYKGMNEKTIMYECIYECTCTNTAHHTTTTRNQCNLNQTTGLKFHMAQTNSFYLKDDNSINKASTMKTRLSATTGHLQQETWPAQS